MDGYRCVARAGGRACNEADWEVSKEVHGMCSPGVGGLVMVDVLCSPLKDD